MVHGIATRPVIVPVEARHQIGGGADLVPLAIGDAPEDVDDTTCITNESELGSPAVRSGASALTSSELQSLHTGGAAWVIIVGCDREGPR